jgi:hypothetical protein
MADFYQTGIVPTLHRLTTDSLERLEADLERYTRTRPVGLVLPALYFVLAVLWSHPGVRRLRRDRPARLRHRQL